MLQSHFESSPVPLIRLKAQAAIMRSGGTSTKKISSFLFVSPRTVERWLRDFLSRRMASIFSGRVGNQYAAKLTRDQKEEIKRVLSEKPSCFGLPFEFWDVPKLRSYVFARFGVVYESDRSYHFLLEFGYLSFKAPDKFRVERDERKIALRMEEIYGEIVPLMEDPNYEVFCADECGMRFQSEIRRAWLKKGEKTVIKVEKKDLKQDYIGFLNQKTFRFHLVEIDRGKAVEIIKAIIQFLKLYPRKKIIIIWDNATHHKGHLFQKALSKTGPLKRVHLIPLPPYAPDRNPVEHVWKFGKDKVSNRQERDFEETKRKFTQLTDNQIFPYEI